MGVEKTFPCAQVEHLADLLRNRVNSQQYHSIYEGWRPKLYRTLKNVVRRLLWDGKVPGASVGTRAATAPKVEHAGTCWHLPQDLWTKAKSTASSPALIEWC